MAKRNDFSSLFENAAIKENDINEMMFANLFDKHMLFESRKKRAIKLLIFGCGEQGRTAFKLAFSTGQVPDRELHIAVVAKSGQEELTDNMPLLPKFTELRSTEGEGCWLEDGKLKEELYADVVMEKNTVSADNVCDIVKRYEPTYVIFCFEADKKNRELANTVFTNYKSRAGKPFISYVQLRAKGRDIDEKCVAVRPVKSMDEIDKNLNIFAFNANFVYDKTNNERITAARILENFKSSYCNSSSIACALHLKYKLRSLGIDPADRFAAAKKFAKKLKDRASSADANDQIEKLIYVEHRRWTARTIADGFDTPNKDAPNRYDYIWRSALDYKNKDAHLHPAAVSSRPGEHIPEDLNWLEDDVSNLDDLDRVSVELYRVLAKNLNKRDEKIQELRASIGKLLSKVLNGLEIFMRVESEIELILKNDRSAALRFIETIDLAKSELRPIVSDDDFTEADKYLEELRQNLFLRIQFLKKYDYKSVDKEMVEGIPLLLKYTPDLTLLQRFSSRDGDMKLWAVRNAVDHDASGIIWFDNITDDPDFSLTSAEKQIESRLERLSGILGFIKMRSFLRSYTLVLMVSGARSKDRKTQLESYIASLCEKLSIPEGVVQTAYVTNKNTCGKIAVDYAKKCTASSLVNCFEKHSEVYAALNELGTTGDAPIHLKEEFSDCIDPKEFRVEEYMTLMGAKITSLKNYGLTKQYRRMWALFSAPHLYEDLDKSEPTSEAVWKGATGYIKKALKAEEERHVLGTIPRPDTSETVRLWIDAEETLMNVFKPLFKELELREILHDVEYSYAAGENSVNQYRVTFTCLKGGSPGVKNTLEAIMQKYAAGNTFGRPKLASDNDRVVCIEPRNFSLNGMTSKNQLKLITRLVNVGCLVKEQDSGETRYRFFNDEAREILMVEGSVLELFIYKAVKNSGEFSDESSNMMFRWKADDLSSSTNEIDCAAVKGKKMFFISAKACSSLDKIMLYEIDSVASAFKAVPILISGDHTFASESMKTRAENMDGLYMLNKRDHFTASDKLSGYAAKNTGTRTLTLDETKLIPYLDAVAAEEEKMLSDAIVAIMKENI